MENNTMETQNSTTTEVGNATDEIMQCFTNIAALMHMAEGWVDASYPFRGIIHKFDPSIMPQMIKTRGEMKILLKKFSKLLRDDAEAIDIMYEHIGKSVSLLATIPYEKRKKLVEDINRICEEAVA